MQRTHVESTNLKSVGWEAKGRVLEVEFHTGRVYQYQDVPHEVYRALKDAPSIGVFFNTTIRPYYKCQEVQHK